MDQHDDCQKHIWTKKMVDQLVATPSETIQLCSSQGSIQTINKELLCYFSKYYRAALNGRFAEAHQQLFNVDLSGQQLTVFTAWIYTGQLELLKWNREDRLMLYVFADFAEILALRRQIMTEEGRMERYKEVGLAITHLPDNSPYRKRIVDHYARHWKTADDRYDGWHPKDDAIYRGFWYQVWDVQAQEGWFKQPKCPCCRNPCNYHEHVNEEEWEATCGQLAGSKKPEEKFFLRSDH
ncbi:hypothetical protein D6C82_09880 [Aureobasidium pullulans]|nr:hypothetical protein D6C82_09880 [Aureobasidium pullulans]